MTRGFCSWNHRILIYYMSQTLIEGLGTQLVFIWSIQIFCCNNYLVCIMSRFQVTKLGSKRNNILACNLFLQLNTYRMVQVATQSKLTDDLMFYNYMWMNLSHYKCYFRNTDSYLSSVSCKGIMLFACSLPQVWSLSMMVECIAIWNVHKSYFYNFTGVWFFFDIRARKY